MQDHDTWLVRSKNRNKHHKKETKQEVDDASIYLTCSRNLMQELDNKRVCIVTIDRKVCVVTYWFGCLSD